MEQPQVSLDKIVAKMQQMFPRELQIAAQAAHIELLELRQDTLKKRVDDLEKDAAKAEHLHLDAGPG